MNYRDEVLRTLNPAHTVDEHLVNAALGLAGEAGEIADSIKKIRFQGHKLDTEALIKEAGDLRWYLELLAICLETTVDAIEQRNIAKLRQRYPDGFSADRSQRRED